jgi:hypothetical protein
MQLELIINFTLVMHDFLKDANWKLQQKGDNKKPREADFPGIVLFAERGCLLSAAH